MGTYLKRFARSLWNSTLWCIFIFSSLWMASYFIASGWKAGGGQAVQVIVNTVPTEK